MTECIISKNENPSTISYKLFGCNMELTRKTGFGGIYAQMLNNRKFFAHEEADVCGWEYDDNALFSTETTLSNCNSNFFVVPAGAYIKTAEDNTVYLHCGREYELAVNVSGKGALKLCLGDSFEYTFEVDSTAAKRVSVKLALQQPAEDITLYIQGVEGKVNIYSASLMPCDHFHNMRRDVVECLKEIAPAQLRFPGGCFSDHYDWKDALKDPDERKPIDGKEMPFLLRDTYHQDAVELSVDDFVALCDYVGAAPELTVRMITPMQEALDLVEYCNGSADTKWGKVRQQRGYDAYNIKEWYIGNEIYTFGKELAKDPVLAAQRTNEYIAAMKKISPDIVTIATCITELPHWNDPYFEGTQSTVDRYSFHYYLTCEFRKDWGHLDDDKVLGVVDNAMLPELTKTYNLIQSAKSDVKPAISYDEWNYAWGVSGSCHMMISNALVFNFLCRDAHKYNIEKSLFFHPVNEGMVKVTKQAACIDTSGELMKQYMSFRAAQRLDVERTADSDYPIDLAAATKDGATLVSAINKNVKAEQKLCLKGLQAKGKSVTVKTIVPDEFSAQCNTFKWQNKAFVAKQDELELILPPAAISYITIE